jgi:2-haloacid dehalogenase
MSGYTARSTGMRLRAVLFDTFGTVVDWRSGIAAAVGAFVRSHGLGLDPGEFADAWRGLYMPSMARVRSGERPFVSLDVLHRENLVEALRSHSVDPGRFAAVELDGLARAWHVLPPWPDSGPGILELKRNFIVGPLSNGNTSLLLDMAKAGGLAWDVILGSDVSQAYKPDALAYLRPCALLGLSPGEVMLAAAHNGDLAAARSLGLATGFIARPNERGPGHRAEVTPTADWDVAATSIIDLARQLNEAAAGQTGEDG